jgi:hypothetical protein
VRPAGNHPPDGVPAVSGFTGQDPGPGGRQPGRILVALSTTRQPDPAGHGRHRRAGPAHCHTHHQPVRAGRHRRRHPPQVGAFLAPGQAGGGTGTSMGSHRATGDSTDVVPRSPHGRAVVIRPREQVDPDTLAAALLAMVQQSVQPVRLSLWLRPPPGHCRYRKQLQLPLRRHDDFRSSLAADQRRCRSAQRCTALDDPNMPRG